jgi:SnoaL-like protein
VAGELDSLLESNRAFYEAFEARSIEAMASMWEHSSRVICTHPGWPPIHGWAKVSASWYLLFTNSERLHFVATDEMANIVGDIGWVSCTEDILEGSAGGRVVAFNLFVRSEGYAWLMIAHIASSAPR